MYNTYYNYQTGVWGQISPLPSSTNPQNWTDQTIIAGDVMHDGKFIITWNVTLEKNDAEYVSSAVYDKNTNAWTQVAHIVFSHEHCLLIQEKCAILLKTEQTYTISTAARTGYHFNGSS